MDAETKSGEGKEQEDSVKGGIIYQPNGLAAEYGNLGANLYNPGPHSGCRAGCRYCSNPHGPAVRARRAEVEARPFKPRKDVIERLRHDCEGRYRNCKRPVVMGFVGDIYQPHKEGEDVTRAALKIMVDHGIVPAVLTKFGTAATRDFDLLKAAGGWFGQTMSMCGRLRQKWEPDAAPMVDRADAFVRAQRAGLQTWCSVEPVVDTEDALCQLRWMAGTHTVNDCRVAHIKLGKLNGYDAETRAIEKSIDWPAYREEARRILNDAGYREITEPGAFEVGTYYVKKELREA